MQRIRVLIAAGMATELSTTSPLVTSTRTIYDKFREDHEQVSNPADDFMQGFARHPHAEYHKLRDDPGAAFNQKTTRKDGDDLKAEAGATKEAGSQQQRRRDDDGSDDINRAWDESELDELTRSGVSREVANISIKMQWGFVGFAGAIVVTAFVWLFDLLGDPLPDRAAHRRYYSKKEAWDEIMDGDSGTTVATHTLKWGLVAPTVAKI